MLSKTHHRLLYIDLLDSEDGAKFDQPKPSERFLATFYDYTNNRTVLATGQLARPNSLELSESGLQFRPSQEEFDEAVQTLREDPEIGPALREGRLIPYQAMPPLVGRELPDGRIERTIGVGLLPREGTKGHEIVGVRMAPRAVLRFGPTERGRAPADGCCAQSNLRSALRKSADRQPCTRQRLGNSHPRRRHSVEIPCGPSRGFVGHQRIRR